VTGSHIDTQPTGGKFDGNYGVLAGIEVVRTLNDRGLSTKRGIEVLKRPRPIASNEAKNRSFVISLAHSRL